MGAVAPGPLGGPRERKARKVPLYLVCQHSSDSCDEWKWINCQSVFIANFSHLMPANNSQLIKLHYVRRTDTVVYVYVEQEHKVILTRLTGRKPCTSRCYFLYPKCAKIYQQESRISKFSGEGKGGKEGKKKKGPFRGCSTRDGRPLIRHCL